MSPPTRRVEAADYTALKITRDGPILVIAIDHPESTLNAVDSLLHDELTRVFAELKRENEARAVVLTGEGRAFSAGGDFEWFPTLDNLERLEALRRDAKQMIWDLLDIPIPIVAAINGPAVGLGASLALLCDTIFISEKAHIADPHVLVGIVAGDGGTAIWPLAVGPSRAKQYLMTGDPVPAIEAERIGLVNFVVPPEELRAAALAFAGKLAAGAPLAIQYTKMAVNKLVKDALNTAFDAATALEIVTFQSDDHKEALSALKEKRRPEFKGR
jgi:enoyl-CoA hydratase